MELEILESRTLLGGGAHHPSQALEDCHGIADDDANIAIHTKDQQSVSPSLVSNAFSNFVNYIPPIIGFTTSCITGVFIGQLEKVAWGHKTLDDSYIKDSIYIVSLLSLITAVTNIVGYNLPWTLPKFQYATYKTSIVGFGIGLTSGFIAK